MKKIVELNNVRFENIEGKSTEIGVLYLRKLKKNWKAEMENGVCCKKKILFENQNNVWSWLQ